MKTVQLKERGDLLCINLNTFVCDYANSIKIHAMVALATQRALGRVQFQHTQIKEYLWLLSLLSSISLDFFLLSSVVAVQKIS